jgi:Domain of unknown function (DUF1877)
MDANFIRINAKKSENLSSAEGIQSLIKHAQNQADHILNLDESWCAIHFVMTGEHPIPKDEAQRRGISWNDDSLENVIMGGISTPYKTSLGVARYLNSQQVARIAGKLDQLPVDKFKEWYDPEALIEGQIPPENWDEGITARDWLVDYFKKLVEFYKAAADFGDGILIII